MQIKVWWTGQLLFFASCDFLSLTRNGTEYTVHTRTMTDIRSFFAKANRNPQKRVRLDTGQSASDSLLQPEPVLQSSSTAVLVTPSDAEDDG